VLGTIDGQPTEGCGAKDSSHYWSYWHRAPGSRTWTYSNEGGGSYRPANTATEGWVWQNGASRRPTNVPYSQICRPSPTPTPHRTSTPPQSGSPSRHHHSGATSPASATTGSAGTVGSGIVGSGHADRGQHPVRRGSTSATATPALSGTPTPSSSTPAVAGAVGNGDVGNADGDTSSGSRSGLIGGVGAIVALGGGAVWLARRKRASP
jgi:hypothetical protein